MTVNETSLLGTIFVETSPNTGTASWTDQTATLVSADLSRSDREDYVGLVNGIIGSGTIVLFNNTSTINPGYWIRLRAAAGNLWSGYVTNVREIVDFSRTTPTVLKTLQVADWVSFVSQITAGPYVGASGAGVYATRSLDINNLYQPGSGTTGITDVTDGLYSTYGYRLSRLPEMTISEALDISAHSYKNGYWKSTTVSPTSATGLDGIIKLGIIPTGVTATFTDGTHTGTPANLCYYQNIEITNDSSEITNDVTVNNNSNAINDYVGPWSQSDATSITNYGQRLSSFELGIAQPYQDINVIPNPHLAYSSDNVVSAATNMTFNRQLLSDLATGATNFLTSGATQPVAEIGSYIGVGRATISTPNIVIAYGGNEYNGNYSAFLVRPNATYQGSVYLRGGVGQSSMAGFCAIRWYDINGAIISTVNGTSATITSTAWSQQTVSATAPANAYSAVMFAWFTFSGGSNAGNRYFCTGAMLTNGGSSYNWFSGDNPDTGTFLYDWDETAGASSSFRYSNQLDIVATAFLGANSTPYRSPRAIIWNAQENFSAVDNIDTYTYVDVWYKGTKWSQIVTGISHQLGLSENRYDNRYMIRIDLRPALSA